MKASIGKIAKELGVSRDTLRRWEAKGKIIAERTPRGHRRYDLAKILGLLPRAQSLQKNTVAYARVSSHAQKGDLYHTRPETWIWTLAKAPAVDRS